MNNICEEARGVWDAHATIPVFDPIIPVLRDTIPLLSPQKPPIIPVLFMRLKRSIRGIFGDSRRFTAFYRACGVKSREGGIKIYKCARSHFCACSHSFCNGEVF